MTGHAGFMTSALLSPSACTSFSPRWFLTVIFAPGVDGVTLRTVSQAEHAGPFRRPVRENFDNNQARADIERFLPQIKLAAEQQAIATSVDSPAQKAQEQAQNMYLFALNADLQKDAVGFANLDGLKGIHLVVHSLRADQIHCSVLISDEKFMGACVYTDLLSSYNTNDQGKTFTWDAKQQPVASSPAPSVIPASLPVTDTVQSTAPAISTAKMAWARIPRKGYTINSSEPSHGNVARKAKKEQKHQERPPQPQGFILQSLLHSCL